MKSIAIFTSAFILFLATCPAQGEVLAYQPNPADLYDLDHSRFYTWGLDIEEDISLMEITAVSLKFDNISNWDEHYNVLYIHLLDSAPDGVRSYYDGEGWGDNFAGWGIELVTYVNLPTTPQDLIYTFTDDQVATFREYLENGLNIGFGIDPDCHFYNDGISLEMGCEAIPEPGCAILLATGAALSILRKRSRR